MNATEQARFDPLYAAMLRALKLHGMAPKTQEGYARAVRPFFDRCPDDQSAEDLRVYFADLLETHSLSAVNIDRCGLQFSYRIVQDKPWNWEKIVKPPRPQRLPDVLTREEMHTLLASVHKLRYRVFFILLFSTGLRLGEGLALVVGDIDRGRMRIHVRGGKGDKDRYGRTVGELLRDGRSLNLQMGSDGKAAVYPKYCKDRRFYEAERGAKAAGLGIWSREGEQQRPWEWRRQQPQ